MAAQHTCTLRGKQLSDVIITDNIAKPKLKAQSGFLKNSVALCPNLHIYHDELKRD